MKSVASTGCQRYAYSAVGEMLIGDRLYVLLNSHSLWIYWSSVAMGIENGTIKKGEHPCCAVSSAHLHAPLSQWTLPTKCTFKGQIVKNFKMVTVEHETKPRVLLSAGSCEVPQITCP